VALPKSVESGKLSLNEAGIRRNNNNKGSRAAWARCIVALCAALAIGLGLMASPAEAAPFAYVTNEFSSNVSVIDTATNPPSVVATVAVGSLVFEVAVTPDGKRAYITNGNPGKVSVIDTASNTVVATVPLGGIVVGVAVTPDGKHAYVTNVTSNKVSVIGTATNSVGVRIPVGNGPRAVGIVPPGVPLPRLQRRPARDRLGQRVPNTDSFNLHSSFTLSSTASIDPVTEPVTLQIGTFITTIPPGSFTKQLEGSFTFAGVIGGVTLNALIKPAAPCDTRSTPRRRARA
jgi:YVTN family beta-propeller protein